MELINLTPHSVEVYSEDQFIGLEQVNPTTWVANSVEGEPIASFPSVGCLRIQTQTVEGDVLEGGIPTVKTEYGELTGVPEGLGENDLMIVSLPVQSMAKQADPLLASRMVAPYKVVRSTENGSIVLGCMGFTY